jgi:hypothetical protein
MNVGRRAHIVVADRLGDAVKEPLESLPFVVARRLLTRLALLYFIQLCPQVLYLCAKAA